MRANLNDPILCYLTTDAAEALTGLKDAGLDTDLALAVLEQLWPEHAIYDIPGIDVVNTESAS